MNRYDNLEIPPFLRRSKHTASSTPVPAIEPKPTPSAATPKKRLTMAYKDIVARDIIANVRDGHDTFGKLRKALSYDDRELRAGIRHARKWQPSLRREGKRMVSTQSRLESAGRRYRVITAN